MGRATRLVLLLSCLPLVACGGDDAPADGDGGVDDDGDTPAADAFVSDCEPTSGTTIALTEVASGFNDPLLVTSPPGDPRLFVVERGGAIKIIEDGETLTEPFLDVSGPIVSGDERGLLGLTFHPEYASNRRFYIYYTAEGDGANTIAEYLASARNPNLADETSGTPILEIDDIATNHNGGMLAFGPDGFLYAATGDGGGGGDPADNGQDVRELLGKVLRLDIDAPPPFVPADNPLVDSVIENVRKEIWHVGLRNPWRWSFDRQTGDLWIGDVGQGSWEEVNRIPSGEGGKNLGWDGKEGLECYEPEECDAPLEPEPAAAYTDPVAVYPNPSGNDQASVVGGYVYRGTCYPDIQGWYFYADFYSSAMWRIDADATTPTDEVEVNYGGAVPMISSFGEDASGELYVVSLAGTVYRLEAN